MIIRSAVLEGDVPEADRAHFDRQMVETVLPAIRRYPGIRDVTIRWRAEQEDGAPPVYLTIDLVFGSLEAMHAALASDIRTRPFDSTRFEITDGTHDPRDVVAALEAALPQGSQLVNSSGHCSCFFAHMPSRPQSHFLTIREFGAIGNGISFAMGVAAARPDEPVVLFDGDGSLLMHVQELETIRRHGLRVIIFAINDGAYGSEIHKLRADGLADDGAVFGRPDFAAIASGFGLAGHRLDDLAALPDLIETIMASGGPAVIDVPVSDQVISPVIQRSHG